MSKESVTDLRDLVVILEVISILGCSTQTVFASVSRVVTGYQSSMTMMYAQIRTGQRFVVVRHCVNVAF